MSAVPGTRSLPSRRAHRSDDADALIVGAGIQGATLAWEMAQRGLRAFVIDRGAAGGENSTASFGLLHGGLRYLQRLDVARWLRSRREQGWFVETLPDLVQPLQVVMPLHAGCLRSPSLFRAAFLADAVATRALHPAGPRTDGAVIPAGAVVPGVPIARDGLVGAARWNEFLLPDARAAVSRLLARADASLVQADAAALIVDGGRVAGIELAGGHRLSARTVVLCAGAATRALARRFDRDLPILSSGTLAFNLLLDLPPPAVVLGVSPTPGRGRSLFLRAEGERTLAGTWYAPSPDGPDAANDAERRAVPARLVERALADVRACLPGLAVRPGHVLDVRAGRLPDVDGRGARLRERDVLVDHSAHGGPAGLWSVLGVKLTTARALSSRAADSIWPGAALGRAGTVAPDSTARTSAG